MLSSCSTVLYLFRKMLFRAPLAICNNDEVVVDSDVFSLLTDAQISKLFCWALNSDVTVKEMLGQAKFIAEQVNEKSEEVFLFGVLPNCKLYGCVSPDGSSHT